MRLHFLLVMRGHCSQLACLMLESHFHSQRRQQIPGFRVNYNKYGEI